MAKGPVGSAARKAVRGLSALLIIAGLAALAAVNGADWYGQYLAEQHIEEFTSVFDNENDPERLEYERQAKLYNARLAGEEVEGEILDYRKQLYYQHEPMMSYIEIPKISVKQPIYHGTEETELMAGIGHFETSSLPVGGKSSHCVLLGHSGMRNARMFDDLRLLAVGDKFVVWTLNEPYAYEVESVRTVTPEEAEGLVGLVEGQDLVTLITCTPYGINSHRLLVRAHRCEYVAEETQEVGMRAYVNDRSAPLLAAMGVLTLAGAASVAAWAARRRKARREGPGEGSL